MPREDEPAVTEDTSFGADRMDPWRSSGRRSEMRSSGRMRTMTVAIAIVALLVVVTPTQARSVPDDPHVVTGTVQLDDGTLFTIDAQSLHPGVVGRAWLTTVTTAAAHVFEISIDCLEITWYQPVYPIPPYLPFHMAEASGRSVDGTRYYVTAYDLVRQPIGFGDRVIIETDPGDGACGAADSIGTPVAAGELAIGP